MYLKKMFLVFLILVFATCFIYCEAKQFQVAEKTQFVERTYEMVWRGIIKNNPIRCFGPYAAIEVQNPSDNQDYSFQLEVIFKAFVTPAQFDLRDLKVGDEILFFKTFIVAKTKERAMVCLVGIYYPEKYKGKLFIGGYKVANPPKRE